MKKWKRRATQIFVPLLTATMIGNTVDIPAFAVALQTENVDSSENCMPEEKIDAQLNAVGVAEDYGTKITTGATGDCTWTVYDSDGDDAADIIRPLQRL